MAEGHILLIDGHAAMYRAFYGIPPLSSRSGAPTNAVLGFVRMVRSLLGPGTYTNVAVVFDGGLSAKRMAALPSYKAQRSPMPDALRPQFASVQEYLDAAGVKWLRADAVEGDDIIAALVRDAGAAGQACTIWTGDKDMFQLVSDRVRMILPTGQNLSVGPAEVQAKTGVLPTQIVEWLALTGDTSDNIDGVPGVGAKTAAKLLVKYGSLAGIWENIATVKPERIGALLRGSRAIVERNVELVRLDPDIPCRLPPISDTAFKPEPPECNAVFQKLDLHSLVKLL